MEYIFLTVIVLAILLCACFLVKKDRLALSENDTNPYDVERMRREMLASATDDEELAYLKELDAIDLHRRHLIC